MSGDRRHMRMMRLLPFAAAADEVRFDGAGCTNAQRVRLAPLMRARTLHLPSDMAFRSMGGVACYPLWRRRRTNVGRLKSTFGLSQDLTLLSNMSKSLPVSTL